MTDKEIDDLIARVSDKFEELVNSGMKFQKEDFKSLPGWARTCIKGMVETHGYAWEVGETRVEDCLVIKIDHPKLKYMDIFPPIRMFMWCGEGHHEAIHPDEALILAFAGTSPKLQMKVLEDRSVEVETEDGEVIVVPHPHEH